MLKCLDENLHKIVITSMPFKVGVEENTVFFSSGP